MLKIIGSTYVCSNTIGNSVKLRVTFRTCHISIVGGQKKKVFTKSIVCRNTNLSNISMLFHSVWQNRSMCLHQGYVLFSILLSCLVILALIIVYRTYEATFEPIDDDH